MKKTISIALPFDAARHQVSGTLETRSISARDLISMITQFQSAKKVLSAIGVELQAPTYDDGAYLHFDAHIQCSHEDPRSSCEQVAQPLDALRRSTLDRMEGTVLTNPLRDESYAQNDSLDNAPICTPDKKLASELVRCPRHILIDGHVAHLGVPEAEHDHVSVGKEDQIPLHFVGIETHAIAHDGLRIRAASAVELQGVEAGQRITATGTRLVHQHMLVIGDLEQQDLFCARPD